MKKEARHFKKPKCIWNPPSAEEIFCFIILELIRKVTLSSPCLWASFHPPYPLFQWYPQSKEIFIKPQFKMLKLRFATNCRSYTVRSSENICSSSGGTQEKGKTGWNSVYHQNWWVGLLLIVVVIQLGAVKIYVVAVEALRKKGRQDETQFTTKFDGFFDVFLNLTLCMAKLRVLVQRFSYSTDNSNMPSK
jgi:hypothetical protein